MPRGARWRSCAIVLHMSTKEQKSKCADLTATTVARVALEIVDSHGVAALSMRRVAAELGVGVMSLYRHVSGRDDVIRGVVGLLLDEVVVPEDPRTSWQETVRVTAHSVRTMALTHPEAFELVAEAPLFEPPVLLHVERIRCAHARQGIGEKEFARMWAVIDGFLTGFLLMETQASTKRPAPMVEELIGVMSPFTNRMRTLLSDETFEDALEAVIAGVERKILPKDATTG